LFALLLYCGSSTLLSVDLIADDAPKGAIELLNDDHVVFIGGTLIEREQRFGHWEAAITTAYPDRDITFRNLGWSADTVWAESRGIFDAPAKGYERLVAQVKELAPTVIVLNYGENESWSEHDQGDEGRRKFHEQYARLIDDLTKAATQSESTGPREGKPAIVLLGPQPMEVGVGPNVDPSAHNADIDKYADEVQSIAVERGLAFVDLRPMLVESRGERGTDEEPDHLTGNGLHLTNEGYSRTADWFRDHLCRGLSEAKSSLPAAQEIALLTEIRRKNELYFHRWRPQNITYLFLFRKHEQGNNAVEIPQFDPLILQAEAKIAELRANR